MESAPYKDVGVCQASSPALKHCHGGRDITKVDPTLSRLILCMCCLQRVTKVKASSTSTRIENTLVCFFPFVGKIKYVNIGSHQYRFIIHEAMTEALRERMCATVILQSTAEFSDILSYISSKGNPCLPKVHRSPWAIIRGKERHQSI